MNLLMSYSNHENSLEKIYFDAFKKLNVLVTPYNHSDYSFTSSISSKIIHRIYPYYHWDNSNRKLLELAARIKPDILLIFKGMDLYPKTLLKLKEKGIKLANFNPDHPFIYVSRGSGNRNVRNSIPCFDLHITYSEYIAASFRKKYPGIRIEVIPFGFGLSKDEFQQFSDEKEIIRACFVGHADRKRAAIIQNLIANNLEVDVYGSGWSGYFPNPPSLLRVNSSLDGLDYYRVLHRYRVQLNLFRGHNEASHNMRSFEVPAAGGIMLAPDTEETRKFFINESEVFLYNSLADIPSMVRNILSLSENTVNTIRYNARKRSVSSGYDYDSRSVQFIKILQSISK